MAEEKKSEFVPRHEWERSRGQINEKINEVDAKHTENYNILNNKIDRQTLLQEQSIQEQKDATSELKEINKSLTGFNTRVIDLEYKTKENSKEINSVKGSLDERQKSNTNIITATITVIGSIIVAIIGLAQYFF